MEFLMLWFIFVGLLGNMFALLHIADVIKERK